MTGFFQGPTFFRRRKQDCPFRIIISSINSLLYSLAVFLHNIITKTIPKNNYIENNFELVKELEDKRLRVEFQLMSLDVVSFFINISIDYAMDR